MIPASFAPMILKLIMPKVMEHIAKTFKLSELIAYMEMPNDADKIGEKNKNQIE